MYVYKCKDYCTVFKRCGIEACVGSNELEEDIKIPDNITGEKHVLLALSDASQTKYTASTPAGLNWMNNDKRNAQSDCKSDGHLNQLKSSLEPRQIGRRRLILVVLFRDERE